MADETADAVKKSLGRCLMDGDVFSTFYEIFLDSDPRIPGRFAETQWEEQKRLLRQGVNNVISFYTGSLTAQSSMDRIRQSHRRARMDIPPDLYDAWISSMVEAPRPAIRQGPGDRLEGSAHPRGGACQGGVRGVGGGRGLARGAGSPRQPRNEPRLLPGQLNPA